MLRFIEVVVTPTTIPTILPASFFGGTTTNSVTAGASAVAGMNQTVCKFTPMFICNPYENPDGSMSYGQATQALLNAMANPAMRRRLIQMRQGGGGGLSTAREITASWIRLCSATAPTRLRDAIAMVSPPACFGQNGVDTKPGFIASVRAAVNVRFDIYEGPMNGSRERPEFPSGDERAQGLPSTGRQRVQCRTRSRHGEVPGPAARYLLCHRTVAPIWEGAWAMAIGISTPTGR